MHPIRGAGSGKFPGEAPLLILSGRRPRLPRMEARRAETSSGLGLRQPELGPCWTRGANHSTLLDMYCVR